VVGRVVVAAAAEVLGRDRDDAGEPRRDRLPELLDDARHHRLGGHVRRDREQARPVAAHAPHALGVFPEQQVETAELPAPLVRLDDDRAVHVVLAQLVAAPDELARGQAGVRVAAHDDVDAGHFRRDPLVRVIAAVREQDDDVRLFPQRLHDPRRRRQRIEDLDRFLRRRIGRGVL